jgi:hypothetical protein
MNLIFLYHVRVFWKKMLKYDIHLNKFWLKIGNNRKKMNKVYFCTNSVIFLCCFLNIEINLYGLLSTFQIFCKCLFPQGLFVQIPSIITIKNEFKKCCCKDKVFLCNLSQVYLIIQIMMIIITILWLYSMFAFICKQQLVCNFFTITFDYTKQRTSR